MKKQDNKNTAIVGPETITIGRFVAVKRHLSGVESRLVCDGIPQENTYNLHLSVVFQVGSKAITLVVKVKVKVETDDDRTELVWLSKRLNKARVLTTIEIFSTKESANFSRKVIEQVWQDSLISDDKLIDLLIEILKVPSTVQFKSR
jgi:hypothetical protein